MLFVYFLGISVYCAGGYFNSEKPEILDAIDSMFTFNQIESWYKIGRPFYDLKGYLDRNHIGYRIKYLTSNNDCEKSNVKNLFWCYDVDDSSNTGVVDIYLRNSHYIYFKDGKIVKYSEIPMGMTREKISISWKTYFWSMNY